MNSIPFSGSRLSRYISPCCRVSSSVASSTAMTAPSGSTTAGCVADACAAVVAVCLPGTSAAGRHAARRPRHATQRSRLLILHLLRLVGSRVARDQIVFFCVVTERTERHLQQFGGLRLHAVRPLERAQHERLAYILEMFFETDAFFGEVEFERGKL